MDASFRNSVSPAQKGSAPKWRTPLLLVVAALLLGAAMCIPTAPRLTVSNARTNRIALVLPIEEGETFLLRFEHSVNRSDVTDFIEWTGTELVCRSTLFTAFGAGMPVLSDGVGTDFTSTDEGFLITGIDKHEQQILVMLQTVPNHRLLCRGGEYALLNYLPSGSIARIEVRKTSFLARALHGA